MRSRFESKQSYNFVDSSQDYVLTQTRLRLSYTSDAGSEAFLELQDARVAGESLGGVPPVDGKKTPNVFEDHLDIHQATWSWKLGDARLRVGRQKLNLGDQRLVASLEWVNTARVNDAVRLTLGRAETREFDVFLSELVAVDPDDFNDQARTGDRYLDSSFHGVFAQDRAALEQGRLQYWFFYRENRQFRDEVSTLGLRFINEDRLWQPDLQAAYQHGRLDGEGHSAWMMHLAARRDFDEGSFSFAYNFGSGDTDPLDGKHETFDNLYPLNHPYYGQMDLFSLQNIHNVELSYARRFRRGVQVSASWNAFWLVEEDTDAWYSGGLAPVRTAEEGVDAFVGHELDITLQVPLLSERLSFLLGLSAFFTGGYIHDAGLSRHAEFYHVGMTYTIR